MQRGIIDALRLEHERLSARLGYIQRAFSRRRPSAYRIALDAWCEAEEECSAVAYDAARFGAQAAEAKKPETADACRLEHERLTARASELLSALPALRAAVPDAVETLSTMRSAAWDPDPLRHR